MAVGLDFWRPAWRQTTDKLRDNWQNSGSANGDCVSRRSAQVFVRSDRSNRPTFRCVFNEYRARDMNKWNSIIGALIFGAIVFGGVESHAGCSGIWQDTPADTAPADSDAPSADAAPQETQETPPPQDAAEAGGEAAAEKPQETATPPAAAETTEAVPADAAAGDDKSFDELLAEWQKTYEQLVTLEKAARSDEATDEAKTVYTSAVDQAYQLLDQLEAASIAAIAADPNNERATETLVGIMLNASRKTGNDRKILLDADGLFAAASAEAMLDKALSSTRMQPYGRDLFNEIKVRLKEAKANDLPRVKLVTSKGELVVELFEDQAPNTVANFISLVNSGKYANTPFHRVIEGFMAQTGDFEKKDGTGGPGYTIACECSREDHRTHYTGTLSMAHGGKDTGGSQFFICFGATPHLDGRHTAFGRVVSGFDVLDSLTRTHSSGLGGETPIPGVTPDTIVSAEVVRDRGHEYKPETTPDPAK